MNLKFQKSFYFNFENKNHHILCLNTWIAKKKNIFGSSDTNTQYVLHVFGEELKFLTQFDMSRERSLKSLINPAE